MDGRELYYLLDTIASTEEEKLKLLEEKGYITLQPI